MVNVDFAKYLVAGSPAFRCAIKPKVWLISIVVSSAIVTDTFRDSWPARKGTTCLKMAA
jgi:hypothetical protein